MMVGKETFKLRFKHTVVHFSKIQQKLSSSNLEGLDSKEWKSVVLPKIYEEKMQKLEAELEKKVRVF